MAHIFISYSRKDQAYARKLAESIRQHGFDVWIDDRIDYGNRWWRTIVQAIEECVAFVVVMSPPAEQSEWVEREILVAQREVKPIFPLLLSGREFALLITPQFADVRNGDLPPDDFYQRLAQVITPAQTSGEWVLPDKPAASSAENTWWRYAIGGSLPVILLILIFGGLSSGQTDSVVVTNTRPPTEIIAESSPTVLVVPTSTATRLADTPTPTISPTPAMTTEAFHTIEYFTATGPVAPGEDIILLWSTRLAENVAIYQLDEQGQRERGWTNVPSDGRQVIATDATDSGPVTFVLVAEADEQEIEQSFTVELVDCEADWFFDPAPAICPDAAMIPDMVSEQAYERGWMLHLEEADRVYVVFTDGQNPAWLSFESVSDIEVERDDIFNEFPPSQPFANLWWGNETIRDRLGMATDVGYAHVGFSQRATSVNSLYISSMDDDLVWHLVGDGSTWERIETD
jgi:hypothetical protein